MADESRKGPAPSQEQRRQEFAPHQDPKKQPDGDPGPRTSTREGSVNERGPETPESGEDETGEA